MHLTKKKVALTLASSAAVVSLVALEATAGAAATVFDPILQLITEWMQGQLGSIIAAAFILVGMVAGVARQSLMAFAVGVGGGVALFYAPDIIAGLSSATIPAVM